MGIKLNLLFAVAGITLFVFGYPAAATTNPYKLESYMLRDRIILTDKQEYRKALYVAFSSSNNKDRELTKIKATLFINNRILSRSETYLEARTHGNLVFDLPQTLPEGELTLVLTDNKKIRNDKEHIFNFEPRLSKYEWRPDKLQDSNLSKLPKAKLIPIRHVGRHKNTIKDSMQIYRQPPLIYFGFNENKKEELHKIDLNLVRNEHENIAIEIIPPDDVHELTWSVSELLHQSTRTQITDIQLASVEHAEDSVGVPKGRFRYIPRVIYPKNRIKRKGIAPLYLWLTIKTGVDMPSGIYKGKLFVNSKHKTYKIPININLHPITLEDIPGVDYCMLMTYEFTELVMPSSKNRMHAIKQTAKNILQDYLSHGMTTICPHSTFISIYDNNGELILDDLFAALHTMKELGFKRPLFWYMGHLIQTAKPRHPGNITGFNEEVHFERLSRIVRTVKNYTVRHNLPEVIYLPIDEPEDSHQDYKGLRKKITSGLISKINSLGAKTMVTAEKFSNFSATDYLLSHQYNEKERKLAQEKGRKYWIYRNDIAVDTRNPGLARYWYGLYTWKNQLDGMATWTFQNTQNLAGDPLRADTFGRDVFLAYPHPDGPLSTPTWEAIRDGIEDHKLIYQLEKRIDKLKKMQQPTKRYDSFIAELKKLDILISNNKSVTKLEGIRFDVIKQRLIEHILDTERTIPKEQL